MTTRSGNPNTHATPGGPPSRQVFFAIQNTTSVVPSRGALLVPQLPAVLSVGARRPRRGWSATLPQRQRLGGHHARFRERGAFRLVGRLFGELGGQNLHDNE